MINFFKGIIGGIGNIIPGLSGSALLIILGVYEKCIIAITEIVKFKNVKKNIIYLVPIALGIGIGTILFGNIIEFLINKWPMFTTFAFFGLILGSIPFLFGEANKQGFKKKYFLILLVTLVIGIVLTILEIDNNIQLGSVNFIQQIILGIVLASSTIIPGISSTVLLSIIGMYDIYLHAIAEVNIVFLIPVGIGFGIGVIIFSFLVNYLLKNYYGFTFYGILGFIIATLPTILRGNIELNMVSVVSIVILIISFEITYIIGKRIN